MTDAAPSADEAHRTPADRSARRSVDVIIPAYNEQERPELTRRLGKRSTGRPLPLARHHRGERLR